MTAKRSLFFFFPIALGPVLYVITRIEPGTKVFWTTILILIPLAPILPYIAYPIVLAAVLYSVVRFIWTEREWRYLD